MPPCALQRQLEASSGAQLGSAKAGGGRHSGTGGRIVGVGQGQVFRAGGHKAQAGFSVELLRGIMHGNHKILLRLWPVETKDSVVLQPQSPRRDLATTR